MHICGRGYFFPRPPAPPRPDPGPGPDPDLGPDRILALPMLPLGPRAAEAPSLLNDMRGGGVNFGRALDAVPSPPIPLAVGGGVKRRTLVGNCEDSAGSVGSVFIRFACPREMGD